MVDNITIPTTGSGDATPDVATDDVSGVHYQKVKLYDSTVDSSTGLSTGDGLKVVTASTVIDLTLSLSTSPAYSDGDVLAAAQELTNAVRASGGTGVIQSIAVIDKDDQGQALDIVISDSTITLGTENAAVSISDADAAKILGIVEVTGSDYVDLVNSQYASIKNIGLVVMPDTTSLYISAVSRGTGTYTASGIDLRFGIIQD